MLTESKIKQKYQIPTFKVEYSSKHINLINPKILHTEF